MSHGASGSASAHDKLGEPLFGEIIVALPKDELGHEYSWQATEQPWDPDPTRSHCVLPNEQKLLPPHAAELTDQKTREMFNKYIKKEQPKNLYATLPPTEISYQCPGLLPGRQGGRPRRCNRALQGWSRTCLIQRETGYMPSCLAHHKEKTHKQWIAEQDQKFGEFCEWTKAASSYRLIAPKGDHESISKALFAVDSQRDTHEPPYWPIAPNSDHERNCDALFGMGSRFPPGDAFQLHESYLWRAEETITQSPGDVSKYSMVDAMAAQRFLPPTAGYRVDPVSCAEFDMYIKTVDPERIYATIPPLSTHLQCEYTEDSDPSKGEIKSRRCPVMLESWSQAVLHQITAGHYTLWCLEHDPLDVHKELVTRQEQDIRLLRQLDSGRTGHEATAPAPGDSAVAKRPLTLNTFAERAHGCSSSAAALGDSVATGISSTSFNQFDELTLADPPYQGNTVDTMGLSDSGFTFTDDFATPINWEAYLGDYRHEYPHVTHQDATGEALNSEPPDD